MRMSMGKISKQLFSSLRSFDNLEIMNHYLAAHKHPLLIVYFRANWNPNCIITDVHVRIIQQTFANIQIITIDSQTAKNIKSHYQVKAQPQWIFCLHGDEVVRQTGPHLEGLQQKSQAMIEMSEKIIPDEVRWTPFGTKFNKFYKNVI